MTNPEIIGWVVLSIAGFLTCFAQFMYARDMYWLRRHLSRFRLFAARDELVSLVARGEMEEDDIAWEVSYVATNSLLDIGRSRSVWALIGSYMNHQRRVDRDPDFARFIKTVEDQVTRRAKEVPAFDEALRSMRMGEIEMRRAQTHWWDVIALHLLYVVAWLIRILLFPLRLLSKGEAPQKNWQIVPESADDLVLSQTTSSTQLRCAA